MPLSDKDIDQMNKWTNIANFVVTRPDKSGYLFSPVKIVCVMMFAPPQLTTESIKTSSTPPPPPALCEVNVWTPVCADTR